MNNFAADLAWSHGQSDQPFWEPVYRKAFPTLASCVNVPADGWQQRAGVDRVLVLSDSKTLYVDEKVRRKDRPDIALEIYSDERAKKKGWAIKPALSDFIAYAFLPTQTCFLLPFHLMQRALRDNWVTWTSNAEQSRLGFQQVRAQNPGYTTLSIAVPIMVLLDAMSDSMVVTWSADDLRSAA
jgi:hypothetical protein